MTTPDPFDVGAILSAALTASGLSAADVARATGIPPSHLSRLLRDPNARAPAARRVLEACGCRVEVTEGKRGRKARE